MLLHVCNFYPTKLSWLVSVFLTSFLTSVCTVPWLEWLNSFLIIWMKVILYYSFYLFSISYYFPYFSDSLFSSCWFYCDKFCMCAIFWVVHTVMLFPLWLLLPPPPSPKKDKRYFKRCFSLLLIIWCRTNRFMNQISTNCSFGLITSMWLWILKVRSVCLAKVSKRLFCCQKSRS